MTIRSAQEIDPTNRVTPSIYICTFGTLQMIRNDQIVAEGDWHTRQARQLLKILITERPRPVPTDRLIETLWPQSRVSAASTTLRSAINALRNVLEPDRASRAPSKYILTRSPGYAFYQHPTLWLDVEQFEQALSLAQQATERPQRQQHLQTALDLYQDDYLTTDPYADWAQSERDRLRERYFSALLQMGELQADEGAYAEAIASCRRILAQDEVRENAYQALMRYQAESGDSAAALRTYERCRTLLAEELGADPSPLTQQWHQRILNGDITFKQIEQGAKRTQQSSKNDIEIVKVNLVKENSVKANPIKVNPITTIPSGVSLPEILPQQTLMPALNERFMDIFVGREPETTQVKELLNDALKRQGRLLLLEGEAGVGKTRLAYQLLEEVSESGATVISATCQPIERQLPFAPLADGIGRYLHSLPTETLHHLPRASLSQLAQIMPTIQDRWPDLPVPAQDNLAHADENRQRLIDGLIAFIDTLSKLRPLVLFLDDLHWADSDTLAVLSRLSQRLHKMPIFVLLAYRGGDLAENKALATLLHTFSRTGQHPTIHLERLNLHHVQSFVSQLTSWEEEQSMQLAKFLYETTQGNALFMTEAMRALQERNQFSIEEERPNSLSGFPEKGEKEPDSGARRWDWQPNRRVQEVILERIERLPISALEVLQLSAVIGRDFSIELLDIIDLEDPISGLTVLLKRNFLLERANARLDFSHQLVRQVAYEQMNHLQRRHLHRQVADGLAQLERANENPNEIAFHYGEAGHRAQKKFAQYSVLAGERLIRSFGFQAAVKHFDDALHVLERSDDATRALKGDSFQEHLAKDEERIVQETAISVGLVQRALEGRGLAYESLLDPDGVTDTYRRLGNLARHKGERQLMLTAYSRLSSMLALAGQQSESNDLLQEVFDTFTKGDSGVGATKSTEWSVVADLIARRRCIFGPDEVMGSDEMWLSFQPPPPVPSDPVLDILRFLEPIHAVLPLFDYGWTLRIQGQLAEASRCLEMVVALATESGQPLIASTAYHQLAVGARIQGDLQRSQILNEQSLSIKWQVKGIAAELSSVWPRIASVYHRPLHEGRLDEAERRLEKVLDFLKDRNSFRNHRNSAEVGLALVALARGDLKKAKQLLEAAQADAMNLYPYIHVRVLLGLAELAHHQKEQALCDRRLRQALQFAGRRSLIEEYVETVLAVSRFGKAAPTRQLLEQTLLYVQEAGLNAMVRPLREELRARE